MPPSPDPSPAACAPVEGDLGLGWGNAAAQEALGPDLPPGPWAPEVLDRAAGVEGVDAACLLSDPARWAEPADDENPAAPPAAADFWVGSTGPDPLRAASNPIAKAGAPSKTTRTSARFQDDLIDNTSREGQLFDKATATIAHDRAEFRVRHTGDGPHGSEKGAAGSHGENIVRATGDQVMIGRGMSSTDEAGNKHSSEVLVGTGGVAGAASTQLKTADGQTQTLAGGASVGEKGVRGNIRAGLSGPDHTGGLGDPGRATRVTGDGQSAATPDLAREIRDPRNSHAVSTTATATMDGGINVTARLAGQSAAGDWLVRYSVPVDHRVAVQVAAKIDQIDHLASGGPKKAGSPISISGTIGRSGKVELSGTRAFATKQEAEDWATSPRYLDLIELPVRAVDVAALRVGERRRMAASVGLSAEASASAATMAVNAGAGGDGGVAIEAVRDDERWTTVILDGHISGHLAASLGAPLLTIGGQVHAATIRRLTYRFDLSDDEARRAYDGLLFGTLPTPSASVVGPIDMQQVVQGEAASATTPLGTVSSGGQATTTTIDRPDGSRTIVDEGAQVQSFSVAQWLQDLFGVGAGGSNARGAGAKSEMDTNGVEVDARVKAVGRVSGGDAGHVWDELANLDMRGAHRNIGEAEAAGGEWRVTLEWGQGSLDELVAKVISDEEVAMAGPLAYRQFHQALKAADGDREAQRDALRAYGKSGLPARANLQRLLGSEWMEAHLEREGCEVWIGSEGWRRERGAMGEAARVGGPRSDVALSELSDLRLRHHDRLDALEDRSRFREVPSTLRDDEISRTQSFIAEVTALVERIEAQANERRSSGEGEEEQGTIAGRPEAGDPSREALLAAQERSAAAKAKADRAYKAVLRTEKFHMIGVERNHASRWWRLARSSWFGFVVDGPEAESYRDAERFKMEGEEERRLGAGAEKDARFEERHVDLAAATTFLVGAESHYVEAEQGFTASSKVLKGIESRDRKSTGTKP